MTLKDNPLCFENNNGKVEMNIEKSFGDNLVKIK
jgi:hypothetical protein